MDICGVGATLMGSLNFGQNPPPIFSGAQKNNFTMALMGNFCFVVLNLRNPVMEIGEIIEDIHHGP